MLIDRAIKTQLIDSVLHSNKVTILYGTIIWILSLRTRVPGRTAIRNHLSESQTP